ncbi:MAG: hypothetical protein AVDCRST_MAG15-2152, partial [uncultured Rubellimicrobium sp.]
EDGHCGRGPLRSAAASPGVGRHGCPPPIGRLRGRPRATAQSMAPRKPPRRHYPGDRSLPRHHQRPYGRTRRAAIRHEWRLRPAGVAPAPLGLPRLAPGQGARDRPARLLGSGCDLRGRAGRRALGATDPAFGLPHQADQQHAPPRGDRGRFEQLPPAPPRRRHPAGRGRGGRSGRLCRMAANRRGRALFGQQIHACRFGSDPDLERL